MRGSQFNISLGALVVHALKREIEVATAKVNRIAGYIMIRFVILLGLMPTFGLTRVNLMALTCFGEA